MSNKKTSIYVLAGIALCLLIAFIMIPLNSSEAAGNKKTAAWTKPDNFDALSTVPAGEPQTQLMEGGRKVQTESRFNVPTFLWASDPGPARSMRQDAVGKKDDAVAAARSHIGSYADRYRLSRKDIAAARVEMVHNTGTGAIIVKFQQDLGGVPVFRDELNVVMNRDLQLISLSGYLTGDHAVDTSSASNFRLQPEDALAAALADLSGRSVDTSALQRTEAPKGDALSKTDDQYTRFTSDRKALPGFFFSEEPSRTKAVMFHMPDGYTPAYYVETAINVPTMNTNVLHASGEAMPEEWAYGYVISAIDGKVLFRMNQVAEQATYRVWA
ncbi:MAG TPA: hypothetical protein VK612_03830, partial [Pyrinomonadaceae bacterium]|nr:hypothetical protein [Pyrinomonadaceae bacterium]